MSIQTTIREKLEAAFSPESLDVIDESHLHAGHAGHREEGESHFRIKMTSSRLAGQSRVAQHRAVNEVLADELKHPVHALALELSSN